VSNLVQRIITALIGGALVITAILYSEFTFVLLVFLLAMLAVHEFYKLAALNHIKPDKVLGFAIVVLLFMPLILKSGFGLSYNSFPFLIVLPFVVFIKELYSKTEQPFTNIAYTFLGIIYLVVPFFIFYLLSFEGNENYEPRVILGYLFLLWASDTGAYFAGKSFGKRKLFERHSPKKTWEGSIGGTLLALLVSWILSQTYTFFSLTDWIAIAVIIVVTGTLGDLVESMFKRSLHIKESGQLLPGHGGVLDRFDGLFISVPFVFFYFLAKTMV
jgi:phosphatidate cytidylyltransferase